MGNLGATLRLPRGGALGEENLQHAKASLLTGEHKRDARTEAAHRCLKLQCQSNKRNQRRWNCVLPNRMSRDFSSCGAELLVSDRTSSARLTAGRALMVSNQRCAFG